jgi:iron complex transport system ATP-binding protein
LQLLSGYAQSQAAPAMVMVTHHLEEIPPGFTHALLMQDGTVMARGEIGTTLTSASISEAFRHPLTLSYQSGRFSAVSS